MKIRAIKVSDTNELKKLYLSSFDKSEASDVYNLDRGLVNSISRPKTFTLIAEFKNKIVGSVGLSPIYFDKGVAIKAYILAPLVVDKKYQKQGIGGSLVNKAITMLKNKRVDLLFVYGDPMYYKRFGFLKSLAKKFIPPFELKMKEGWQCLNLSQIKSLVKKYKFKTVEVLNNEIYW